MWALRLGFWWSRAAIFLSKDFQNSQLGSKIPKAARKPGFAHLLAAQHSDRAAGAGSAVSMSESVQSTGVGKGHGRGPHMRVKELRN